MEKVIENLLALYGVLQIPLKAFEVSKGVAFTLALQDARDDVTPSILFRSKGNPKKGLGWSSG